MNEKLTAFVGAKISEFRKKMAQVNKTVRDTATKVIKPVGANIREFQRKAALVQKQAAALDRQDVVIDFKGRMQNFIRFFRTVKKHVSEIDGAFQDIQGRWRDENGKFLKVDDKGFIIPVDADLSPFHRAMKSLDKRIDKFQNRMDKIANSIRTFGTIFQNMLGGGLLMISPAAVPVIAGLIGAIGALGPMIGVMGASTFALASAFGLAGIAAVAFGAAAIPTITKLFDENAKLNAQQKAARAEYDKFKSTWQGITKELENPVLEAFGKSMQFATRVLELSRPLFTNVGVSVNRLLDSLNKSMSSPPVLFFFEYMNKTAGPMLETIGKSFGNFMQGFMSMMVAFGPLSASTAQGFLNMSKGFADWAAGLSGSEKFQTFIKYVNENMPKIRSIFRDAIAGIAYFFSAFGPLSSDMMTGLQGLMSRFKEWATNLQSNQAFQNFIGYIRDNAPKVLQLISNLADFIVNMSLALAPIGSQILGIVNSMLSWINSMMTAHPMIGQVIAVLIVLAGGLIALIPNIVAFATLFSGTGTAIAAAAKFGLSAFMPFKNNLIIGLKLMGSNVFSFVTRMGTATASIIANFAKMTAKGAVWVAKFVAQIAVKTAQWALLGAKALLHAARVAAAWFIAMGPIGWVIAVVIGLVALIIANWDKVKKWTLETWNKVSSYVKEKMTKVWTDIKTLWGKAQAFLEGIDLTEIGKNIIRGLINGIGSMVSSVTKKISSVAGSIKKGITGALDIHSPSRFTDWAGRMFGKGLENGIGSMIKPVGRVAAKMAQVAMFEPQTPKLAFDASTGFESTRKQINTSTNEARLNTNRSGESIGGAITINPAPVYIDGYEVTQILFPHISTTQGNEMTAVRRLSGDKS